MAKSYIESWGQTLKNLDKTVNLEKPRKTFIDTSQSRPLNNFSLAFQEFGRFTLDFEIFGGSGTLQEGPDMPRERFGTRASI